MMLHVKVHCVYVYLIYQGKLFSSQFGAAGLALEKGDPS
jgi:hypothetical protein